MLLRRSLSELRLIGTASWQRPLSSVARGGGGYKRPDPRDQETDEDRELVAAQDALMKRFEGPLPVIRSSMPPPVDAVLETWAPAHLVSAEHSRNHLNFRMQYFQSSSDWDPPEAAKVVLRVNPFLLGLNSLEVRRLAAVAGPVRFSRATNVLKLTCSIHTEPYKNKVELRKTLNALIADARENAEAFADAPDSTKPLVDRAEPWLRVRKSTNVRMSARPLEPLINDWRQLVTRPSPPKTFRDLRNSCVLFRMPASQPSRGRLASRPAVSNTR